MTSVLCIDTASADFALAFAEDGHILRSFARDGAQDHSRLLLAAIEEVVEGAKVSGVAVVRGPGSYAGLRVGLATAQGLALALGVPIRGVGTMAAIAASVGDAITAGLAPARLASEFVAIHPAGRGNFAAQAFRGGSADGALYSAAPEELHGLPLAGEGAAALGGTEVSAEARCRAALLLALPLLEDDTSGDVDAIYLREPNITTPRKPTLAQALAQALAPGKQRPASPRPQ